MFLTVTIGDIYYVVTHSGVVRVACRRLAVGLLNSL